MSSTRFTVWGFSDCSARRGFEARFAGLLHGGGLALPGGSIHNLTGELASFRLLGDSDQAGANVVIEREIHRRSRTARRFFLSAIAVTSVAIGGGVLLLRFGRAPTEDEYRIPPQFWGSTVALLTGSVALQRAVHFVSIERQRPFRGHLLAGLAAGTLFVAFQIAGMGYLLQMRENLAGAPIEAMVTVGARPYVFVAAALHAMHFVVAMLTLIYVVVNGFDDRYDHEAYFPVRFCAWFWHALGIFWVAILYVCGIVFS